MGKILATLMLLIGFLATAFQVVAETAVINKYVPDAKKVGEDRLSYFVWDVYDAALYSPEGTFSRDQPFALKLDYLRWLKGIRIAERSAKEIKQQGFEDEDKLSEWLNKMIGIFPSVEKGDTITGIKDINGHAVFYLNDRRIGWVQDREFAERFFDIWLGAKTSQPEMRKELLGL